MKHTENRAVSTTSALDETCRMFFESCRTRVRLLSFLLLLGLAFQGSSLFADTGDEPWDRMGFGGDPKAILQSAQAIPNSKGSDVTVLLDERRFAFDDQGRVTETTRLVYRVNTAEGVEQWGGTGSVWEPWHQERPEIKARVITSDGSVHLLDLKNMTDAPASGNSPQTYSDDRRYHGPLPGVAIGAVVEEEIVTRDLAPFFEGGVSRREYYGRTVPVQESRFVLEAPTSAALHYAVHLLPAAKVKRDETDGKVRITVEMGPMEAMRNDFTNLPTDIPTWPHIDFATGKSWKEVSETYLRASEPQIRLDGIRSTLPAVPKTATRNEIISAIVAKLHKEVRYTGVEFGRSKIIPQTTTEILNRKFGDCKDKAMLLVAMLRAKGIAAHIALLQTEDYVQDVETDMPGMGLFNHAIVVAPGSPDLWIDATAEYSPVGVLPGDDQGRAALVISEGTQGLVHTPEVKSSDNVSVETREFFLAEMGPGRVVETTEPSGDMASSLRYQYSGKLSDDSRKELEEYMKNAYLAEKLTSVEAGNGADINTPYRLRLEADKATRGNAGEQLAVVAVPISGIFTRLPVALRNAQDEDDNDKKAEAGRELAKPRTEDFVLPEAFTYEWRYRIVPPPGFQVHGLPGDKVTPIGPAKLTEQFKAGPDNLVTATFRFDTVKKRYTADEAKQIRTAILKIQSEPMLLISFDQTGYALLQAGKIRESLAAYRSLVALHPKEGLHRAQLANALLEAGLGEQARAEATEATRLEPTSAFAYKTLGWILQHDLIGRRFERGFDLEKAILAYQKAKELDPKDSSTRADLAILLEHDKDGERYAHGANLVAAIKEYQELRENDKDNHNFDDNLAFVLLYAEKSKETLDFLKEVGITSATRRAIFVAAAALGSGPESAIDRSSEISSSENERLSSLYSAGQLLMNMRMYPQAVKLMQAGLAGQTSSPQVLALIEALHKTRRAEKLAIPNDPAEAVVQKFMTKLFTGAAPEDFIPLFSKNALNDGKTDKEHFKDLEQQTRSLRATLKRSGMPFRVLADLALSNMQLLTEKGEGGGVYRVTVQAMGAKTQHLFAVKEGDACKLLGGPGQDMAEVGREILDRVSQGDVAAAKSLLDWSREDVAMGGGDDRLAGPLFPRFWTKGQSAGKESMEYAAAAILVDSKQPGKAAVPILQRGMANGASPDVRTRFELALATEYSKEENWGELKRTAERLRETDTQSPTAFGLLTEAYGGQHDWAGWERVAQDRLQKMPDDMTALRSMVVAEELQGQHDKARTLMKPLIDSGRANSNDMNSYSWSALFTGSEVKPEDIQIAQRALSVENNSNSAIMHTVACLFAAVGRTKEARELLLETMRVGGLDEPDASIWLGMGMLAEQYGEYGAARAAYARVEKPKKEMPITSYALMQLRMKTVDLELGKSGVTKGK